MDSDIRPWGHYEVIQETDEYKIKLLYIKPGQRLSLQKHQYRDEYWMVVKGYGTATVEGRDMILFPGSYVKVSAYMTHRIRAIDDMVIVEAQRGTSFSEDDIIRLEDDYGR